MSRPNPLYDCNRPGGIGFLRNRRKEGEANPGNNASLSKLYPLPLSALALL
jgi:hypothetical protein